MNKLKLLWRERLRVWDWYWFFRRTKPGYIQGGYFRNALRATWENPPVADDYLQGRLDQYDH